MPFAQAARGIACLPQFLWTPPAQQYKAIAELFSEAEDGTLFSIAHEVPMLATRLLSLLAQEVHPMPVTYHFIGCELGHTPIFSSLGRPLNHGIAPREEIRADA